MDLRTSLAEIRKFLLPKWAEVRKVEGWEPSDYGNPENKTDVVFTPATDMCRFTAVFLYLISDGQAIVHGGMGNTNPIWDGPMFDHRSGYRLSDTRFAGHLWVVFNGNILDITADQFGDTEIIVAPVGDSRYVPCEMGINISSLGETCPEVAQWAEDFKAIMARRKRMGMDVPEIISTIDMAA